MRTMRVVLPLLFAMTLLTGVIAGPAFAGERGRQGDRCGRVFAINDQNQLLRLEADDDRDVDVESRRAISGLAPGERLIGIDFRPAGAPGVGTERVNALYGLGTIGGGAGLAQLYIIDTRTAVATPVGVRNATLVGTRFGLDFNPVPDRLRVVSDAGQNIRLNPNDGTVAGIDVNLAYAAGDPNASRTPAVVGVAYTNPDTNLQTNTVLYDIDAGRESDPTPGGGDVLAIQVPPNAGQLNTVGRLQVDTGLVVGFDISAENEALAALQENNGTFSRLFSIDLVSGVATNRGRVKELLTGLAIELGPQCRVRGGGNDD